MEECSKKYHKIIIFFLLGFMLVVSVLNAKNDSAIFDETAHIGASYSYVTRHEMRLNPEHPPLIKDLAGLPLAFMNLNFDDTKPFWTGDLPRKWDEGQWMAGRHLLYEAGNDPDKIIFWSRLPIVILSIVFGLFIFKWARELAGYTAGISAVLLYALDPNILGHNHFVTTDLGIAAFMAFAFYYFLRFVKDPSWKNVGLAGLFVGLLQLAKFSSIISFPIFVLAAVVYSLVKNIGDPQNTFSAKMRVLGEYIGKGALIFAISIVVVWILYAVNTYNTSYDLMAKIIDFNLSPNDNNPLIVQTNKLLHAFNTNFITRPLAEYGIGIGYVFRRVAGGNGAYFMGQVSNSAFPAYFPTVFGMKEPIPTLMLMLFALGYAMFGFFKKNLRHLAQYLKTNITEISLFGFIVLYAYVSVTGNLNIGFRHLFPILPFAYILTAKKIREFSETNKDKKPEKFFSAVVSLLFAYLAFGTITSYPSYMSYFNELAGGPKYGYHYVTDSNADWGQDLKRLKNFLSEHPEIDKIRVDYFGGGDIKHYIGEKYLMWWDSKRPIEAGWYAISTNFLMGSIYDTIRKDGESYRWLKDKEPVYRAGTSILIYHIAEADLDNIK